LYCFFSGQYYVNEETLYQSIDDVVMVKGTEVDTKTEVPSEAEVPTEIFSEYDDVVSLTFPQQYEAP